VRRDGRLSQLLASLRADGRKVFLLTNRDDSNFRGVTTFYQI
jgi:hypothetical protein